MRRVEGARGEEGEGVSVCVLRIFKGQGRGRGSRLFGVGRDGIRTESSWLQTASIRISLTRGGRVYGLDGQVFVDREGVARG